MNTVDGHNSSAPHSVQALYSPPTMCMYQFCYTNRFELHQTLLQQVRSYTCSFWLVHNPQEAENLYYTRLQTEHPSDLESKKKKHMYIYMYSVHVHTHCMCTWHQWQMKTTSANVKLIQ